MKYHSVHNLNHSIPLFYRHTVHLLKEMWRRWVLRSFVWHLLVNLKINYLLKKLLKWANKKCKNFTIYTVVFFLKKKRKKNTWRYLFFFFSKKKKTWRYHYFTPVYQILWWYDLQFLRYRVWQTEIGNCGSFLAFFSLPLKTWKIRVLKKWKKLHVYQKPQSWDMAPEIQNKTDKIF